MDIEFLDQDGAHVARIVGDLDGNTAPDAEARIMEYARQHDRLVLDLAACGYVSSAGLRVLLMLGKQLKAQGGRWALAGVSAEIADVMDMTGFSSFFTLCPDVAAAAQTLSTTP